MFWGVYHGLALIIHREFAALKNRVTPLKAIVDSPLGTFTSMLLTFHAVCIGWVFFRVHDITAALNVAKRMVLMHPLYANPAHTLVILNPDLPVVVPLALGTTVAMLLWTMIFGGQWKDKLLARIPVPVRMLYPATLIIAMVILMPDNQEPFIYFQF
jgi:alginate O-acetyltransferase complex protein AlgI